MTKAVLSVACDFDLHKTYEKKSENYVFELKGLGVPKGSEMVIQISPYERSQVDPKYKRIRDLHYPEWLKVLLKKAKVRVPLPTNQGAKSIKTPLLVKKRTQASASSASRQDGLEEALLKKQEDTVSPSMSASLAAVLLKDKDDQEDVYVVSSRLDDLEPTLVTSLKKEKKDKEDKSTRVMPRGMRIFHPYAQTFRTNFTGLSGKHISTLSSLMNKKEFTPVTYADFASLWKAINGDKSIRESTGSSHKVLLDADGKVVSGIFSHNANMEYTRRTAPYLRAAIDLLGIPVAELIK